MINDMVLKHYSNCGNSMNVFYAIMNNQEKVKLFYGQLTL